MKSIVTKYTAVAFAALAFSARATDPVAVWTEFADGASIDGADGRTYTFNANGNTVASDGSSFTIGSTNSSISVSSAYSNLASTVIVRYSAFTKTSGYQTLITLSGVNGNYTTAEFTKGLIGLCVTSAGGLSGMWKGVIYTSKGDVDTYTLSETGGNFAMVRDGTVGVQGYVDGNLDNSQNGIKASNFYVNEFHFGGAMYVQSTGTRPTVATDLTITGIAIFDVSLTQEEIAAYEFPVKKTVETEVVSINFNSSLGSDTSIALVKDDAWYHESSNYDGSYTFANGVKFTWDSAGFYQVNSDYSSFINGYIDENNDGISLSITGLETFDSYDAYFYFATDTSTRKVSAVTVNGISYSYVNGVLTAESSEDWGGFSADASAATIGTNVMKLEAFTTNSISISMPKKSNAHRGGIAAIQIVGYRAVEGGEELITGTELPATEGWYTNQTHAVDVAVGESAIAISPDDAALTPTTHVYEVRATMNFAVATPVDELLEEGDTGSLFGVQLADDGYLYAYNPTGAWEKTSCAATTNTACRLALVLDTTYRTAKLYQISSDATNLVHSVSIGSADITPQSLAISGEGSITFRGLTSDVTIVSLDDVTDVSISNLDFKRGDSSGEGEESGGSTITVRETVIGICYVLETGETLDELVNNPKIVTYEVAVSADGVSLAIPDALMESASRFFRVKVQLTPPEQY